MASNVRSTLAFNSTIVEMFTRRVECGYKEETMEGNSFQQAVTASPATMTFTIVDVLSIDTAAAAVGVSDPRTLRNWATGNQNLRQRALVRLTVVFQIVQELQSVLSDLQVRQWFTTINPTLNYRSVLRVLDEDPIEMTAPQLLRYATEFAAQVQAGTAAVRAGDQTIGR
ncbi:hypothetical protein [Gordonia malaquae]|nr:hypothetical protein [Gordonia malaquae]